MSSVGENTHGQLGVSQSQVVEPTPLSSQRWQAISLGGKHSAGVGDGGEVYTWGVNDKGQLGAPGGPKAGMWDVPRRVELLYGWDVQGVACGENHTVAITPHDVITWGANDKGQCGHGERAEVDWVKPRSLKFLHGQMVTQVVCGSYHTLCVTATSLVFAWGDNSSGQLGLGDLRNRRSPSLVNGLWALPVRQLAAGVAHSAALTSNGFLFTWGEASSGQLGLPLSAEEASHAAMSRTTSERRRNARRVNQRFIQKMLDMGISEEHAILALMETGNVGVEVAAEWLFSVPPDVLEGHLSGELSEAESPTASLDVTPQSVHHTGFVNIPRRVPLQKVQSMAVGAHHTLACTEDDVYSWGCNSHGQLGNGEYTNQKHPYKISCLSGHAINQVAAGARHSVFLSTDGSVYACGETCGLFPTDVSDPEDVLDEFDILSTSSSSFYDSFKHGHEGTYLHRFDSAMTLGDPSVSSSLHLDQREAQHMVGLCSIPASVPLKFLESNNKRASSAVVSQVVCGDGSTVFLTRRSDELPDMPPPLLRERLQAALESVVQLGDTERQEYLMPICSAVEKVFGSAAAISSAFGIPDAVGLESTLLEQIQRKILRLEPPPAPRLGDPQPERDELHKSLRVGLESLILDIERNIKLMGTPERAQVLLAAMQSPLLGDSRCSNSLIPRVCNIALAAPSTCRHLMVGWWSSYEPLLLEERVVKPLQKYLTDELYATKKLTISVMNAIKVLALVEEANQLGRLLPPEAFYNELISEKLDVLDHYVAWRQTHDMPRHTQTSDGPFSFCSYPFLLNPRAKSKLLHTEARIQMDQTIADARAEAQNGKKMSDEPIVPGPKLPKRSKKKNSRRTGSVQRRASRENRQSQNGGPSSSQRGQSSRWRLFPASRQVYDDGHVSEENESDTTEQPQSDGSPLWKHGSLGLPSPDESGFPATHPEMCIVRIRRCHLLEDALNEVSRQRPRDLFKPLRVHFIGEDGVDAGGVKKEFFQLLMTELLSPDYGMLIFQEETRTYWFDPGTFESDDAFFLLGLIVGLAVYNGVLLDLPLPLALYRRILGLDVKLRDLKDIQPTLVKSLDQILQFSGPGSVEDVFCQTFSVPMVKGGQTVDVPLCPGGDDRVVTEDNRREFVDLYVKWWLIDSVEKQFEAFLKGLLTLCGGPALQLFSPTELERLVCGTPCLDFEGLQKAAKYEGGFNANHRVVRWLWFVVRSLPDEEKKSFLKFVTGSDRAPIGGLSNLRVVIQRDGADSSKLPTSHTCFNTLLLPSYSSREKLQDRLKLAILNAEGFGLE